VDEHFKRIFLFSCFLGTLGKFYGRLSHRTNNSFEGKPLKQEKEKVEKAKKSVPDTNFKAPKATSDTKGKNP
jgi:hypothetical protein